jgi:type IV pilus assembly protein PilM
MAARSLLGLDVGSRFVKAVELTESRAGLAVTGCALSEIPSPEAVPDIVRDLLAHAGFRTKETVSAVSGRNVIVRYIAHPRVADADLAANMKYEVGKYIPFDPIDCYLDFQRLEEPGAGAGGGGGEMRVLMVAARKSTVDDHVALLERLGLIPTVIDVDALALGNAFELKALAERGAAREKVAALVDIGATKTNIAIMKPVTSRYFTREVYVAGDEFTAAIAGKLGIDARGAEQLKRAPGDRGGEIGEAIVPLVEDLCHEIRLSFDYFETQFESEVDEILLSGGGSRVPGLEDAFQRAFGKTPRRWDPTETLPVSGDRVSSADLRENGTQLAVAVGLATRLKRA